MNVAWETPTVETLCPRCHDTGIILQTPDPPVQGVDRVATLCPEHDWPVTMTGQ